MMSKCSVCGKPTDICCPSSLGAMSFYYCEECLSAGREPYSVLTAICRFEEFTDWHREHIVIPTLKYYGKTPEEFNVDVEEAEQEYLEILKESRKSIFDE